MGFAGDGIAEGCEEKWQRKHRLKGKGTGCEDGISLFQAHKLLDRMPSYRPIQFHG